MSDQNTRAFIREALVSLPAKTKNKNLLGRLQQFSQSATKVKQTLSGSLEVSKRLLSVFPDAELNSLAPKVSEIKRKAKSAHRDLTGNVDVVSKTSFESKMIEMDEAAASTVKPLSDLWQKRIDEAVTPYIRLSQAVADLKLKGSGELQKHLNALQATRTRLPSSDEEALATKDRLQALPAVIGTLGLTGRAGKFLVAVADRNGDAKDLDDPEIREFLDRYDLWGSLRVSLGDSK